MAELKLLCCEQYIPAEKIKPVNVTAAVRHSIENLTAKIKLENLGCKLTVDFKDVFEPIPRVNQLPDDVYCTIQLKDAAQKITSRSYSTLWKYCETWETSIDQHVKAS